MQIKADELDICIAKYAAQANEVVVVSPYIKKRDN